MTRTEFRDYLARWGKQLRMTLQHEGPLAGLPVALEDALEVADAMRLLDQRAPDLDQLREWYAAVGRAPPPLDSAAMQAYAQLGAIRETDLASLDEGRLLQFAVRCSNWATLAKQQLTVRRLFPA